MIDPDEHLEKSLLDLAIEHAKEQHLKWVAKKLDDAMIYGSGAPPVEPTGILNCRCEITLNTNALWLLFLGESLDTEFGNTTPFIEEFDGHHV